MGLGAINVNPIMPIAAVSIANLNVLHPMTKDKSRKRVKNKEIELVQNIFFFCFV